MYIKYNIRVIGILKGEKLDDKETAIFEVIMNKNNIRDLT